MASRRLREDSWAVRGSIRSARTATVFGKKNERFPSLARQGQPGLPARRTRESVFLRLWRASVAISEWVGQQRRERALAEALIRIVSRRLHNNERPWPSAAASARRPVALTAARPSMDRRLIRSPHSDAPCGPRGVKMSVIRPTDNGQRNFTARKPASAHETLEGINFRATTQSGQKVMLIFVWHSTPVAL